MNDGAYADGLLKKIDGAAGHAESILLKVDSGKGTLGGIVNDPEVYESLKDVVSGINKSRIGKGLIRHYGKKGAKERTGEEENQGDAKDQGPKTPQDKPGPGTKP